MTLRDHENQTPGEPSNGYLNERDRLKHEVSRRRLEIVPPPGREARSAESIPDEPFVPEPPEPERHTAQYGKAKKRKLAQQPAYLAVRDAPKHPSFKRVVGACCPFSGLSRAELEQHVAGILAMVDEADRRKGRAA